MMFVMTQPWTVRDARESPAVVTGICLSDLPSARGDPLRVGDELTNVAVVVFDELRRFAIAPALRISFLNRVEGKGVEYTAEVIGALRVVSVQAVAALIQVTAGLADVAELSRAAARASLSPAPSVRRQQGYRAMIGSDEAFNFLQDDWLANDQVWNQSTPWSLIVAQLAGTIRGRHVQANVRVRTDDRLKTPANPDGEYAEFRACADPHTPLDQDALLEVLFDPKPTIPRDDTPELLRLLEEKKKEAAGANGS